MNRVDEILNHQLPAGIANSYGIERAYSYCLSPEEACELLRRTLAERPGYRNPALRKVCADIETKSLPCHAELVERLIGSFSKADYRQRQSLGFVLSNLAELLPTAKRRKIQKIFLASQYVGVRRRGYKSAENEAKVPEAMVADAWRHYRDYEGAWLITKKFPVSFLIENREAIQEQFTEGWQFSRLYLRIAENDHSVLPVLKSLDPISYCYVLSKLGLQLEEREAEDFVELVVGDERLGLFVWCLGKMGLWSVLKKLEFMLPEIQEAQHCRLMKKYGV